MPSTNTPGAHAPAASPTQSIDTAQGRIGRAHAIGCDCAHEWLNRRAEDATPPTSLAAWRARCYADAVREYEDRPDFLQLLAAWETGFDSTMGAARRELDATIKRLAGQANALAALLDLFELLPAELLPPDEQERNLVTCASIADGLAHDLATLIGGAA
jgi:hypothetical protein